MGARCDVCHRRPQYGHNVSHSNRKTNRRFKVNVQHRRVTLNGVQRNVYICTRCLRTMVKVPKARKKTKTTTAAPPRPPVATAPAS